MGDEHVSLNADPIDMLERTVEALVGALVSGRDYASEHDAFEKAVAVAIRDADTHRAKAHRADTAVAMSREIVARSFVAREQFLPSNNTPPKVTAA